MKEILRRLARRWLPRPLRLWVVRRTRWPRVGRVEWGALRRLEPVSRAWGGDRGLAVDRHYIEKFLARWAADVRGRVLEVGDDVYTRHFGGERVERAEIVHAAPGHPRASFVADFADAPQLPSEAFDCILCTQTLQLIPDLAAAIATLHRILKPGGVLLATVPGISQIYRDAENRWHDYWRLTTHSGRWLFERTFAPSRVNVEAHGNVLAAVAFLEGLTAAELTPEELDHHDPQYELLITIRAVKEGPQA